MTHSNTELVFAIAEHLSDNGVGTWSITDPYSPEQTGIYYLSARDDTPRAIVIAVYDGADNVESGEAVRQVQIRTRGPEGDVLGPDTLADSVFAVLQDQSLHVPGVVTISRDNFGPMGPDPSGRFERSDNYTAALDF